ncbi:hypothetical protein VNI00_004677 [Paramarasmius palmivorus]|uniref:Uncharacterized protein n=1 Tax=Paramarasmius palmivorus TaxID=297713 RepID=A0AAW0DHU9_9AGAR
MPGEDFGQRKRERTLGQLQERYHERLPTRFTYYHAFDVIAYPVAPTNINIQHSLEKMPQSVPLGTVASAPFESFRNDYMWEKWFAIGLPLSEAKV